MLASGLCVTVNSWFPGGPCCLTSLQGGMKILEGNIFAALNITNCSLQLVHAGGAQCFLVLYACRPSVRGGG